MNHSCTEIEEALWEHAHAGSELAEDVRRHLESCPECAQVFEEAKQIVCAASDDYAAAAPDCRSAVMDRIAKPARKFRPVWVYASALVVLAALIAGGLELRQPSPQPPRVASVITKEPNVPVPRVEIKKQPAPRKSETVAPIATRTHRVWRIRHSRPAPAKEMPVLVKNTAPVVAREVALKEPASRPIAAVIVTGVVDERDPDISYAYRERDAATGAVTECSRTGNLIDIQMRGGQKPPVKGSIDNEKNSNA